jgi:hypothetical protein
VCGDIERRQQGNSTTTRDLWSCAVWVFMAVSDMK